MPNLIKVFNEHLIDFNYKNPKESALLFSAVDCVAQTYNSATQSGVTPYAYFYNKPLLVSDIPGLSDLIKNDNTGLCTAKNSQAIATKLVNLMEEINYDEFQRNITKVKHNYKWSSFVKQWNSFIKNI